MSKTAIVYWTGTGNTLQMAEAVASGARSAGASADLFNCSEFNGSMVSSYDSIAFGCPAMGAEVLEEMEFQPMFDSCEAAINGKKIALFGSYGWGSGEWMNNWEETCRGDGAKIVGTVICCGTPDDSAIADCTALGTALA